MPDNMLQRIYVSKNLFPSTEMQSQVFYSMLDQVYHSGQIEGSTTEILKEIQKQYYALPYIENTVNNYMHF